MTVLRKVRSLDNWRNFFLYTLVLSIPISVASSGMSIVFLYLLTLIPLARGEIRWESSVVQTGIIIMLIGFFAGSLVATFPVESLRYIRKFWRFGLPFVLLFSLKNQSAEPYLRVLMLFATLICAYGVAQYYTGIDLLRTGNLDQSLDTIHGSWHAIGGFSHHLTFGGVFLILFAIFFAPIFSTQFSLKERFVFALSSTILFSSVVMSLGRSSFLGASLAVGVILFFKKPKLIGVAMAVGICVVMILYINRATLIQKAAKTENAFLRRMTYSLEMKNNIDRINMWKAGYRIVRDHPIFGIGSNNFDTMRPYYDEINKTSPRKLQHGPETGVHNIYLQTWMNFGVIGLAGYLTLWLGLLWRIAKTVLRDESDSREKRFLMGIAGGLCGSMIAGLFENNFRDGEVQTTILFAMGLALALIRKSEAMGAMGSHLD